MDHPQVVNEAAVESTDESPPETTGFRRKRLARATGGEKLGCSLYTLEPGSQSWQYHYHTANEEAIFVLEGRGTVRLKDDQTEIGPGDYVALPTGETGAHRVSNSGDTPLRYLCISTMDEPDVAIYPDQDMVGVFAGTPPGGDPNDRTFHRYLRADEEVDYWSGERNR